MSRKRKIGNEKETLDTMNENKENLEKKWNRKKNVSFLEILIIKKKFHPAVANLRQNQLELN